MSEVSGLTQQSKTILRWRATRKEVIHTATVELPIIFYCYPIITSLKRYKRFRIYILQQSRVLSGPDCTLYSMHLTSIWHVAASLRLNSVSWKADVPKGSNIWWTTDSFLCYFTTFFNYTNYHRMRKIIKKGEGVRVLADQLLHVWIYYPDINGWAYRTVSQICIENARV
jgi:hypothetical protein